MKRSTDLKCLDAAALFDRRAPWGAFIQPRSSDVGRGVALIDVALVRGLREWRAARAVGNGQLIAACGVVAEALLPHVGSKARRRLGR